MRNLCVLSMILLVVLAACLTGRPRPDSPDEVRQVVCRAPGNGWESYLLEVRKGEDGAVMVIPLGRAQ